MTLKSAGAVLASPAEKSHSLRKGSFFAQSKLKLWQILGLTIEWAKSAGSSRGSSYPYIAQELEIGGSATMCDWMQFCRDICVEHFLRNPRRLGGEGRIVEIDESLFAKRKYNRGRVVRAQWVFGGWDRESQQGFLFLVEDRSAATLLPIIEEYILPGSIIHSDEWAA